MNRSDYEIVRVEEDRIFIVDLDLGKKSVTNDAAEVYQEINLHFPNKRIIYRDSMGRWDEISYEFPSGVIYKFYHEYIPDKNEIKNFPTSEFLRKEDKDRFTF